MSVSDISGRGVGFVPGLEPRCYLLQVTLHERRADIHYNQGFALARIIIARRRRLCVVASIGWP